MVRACDVLIVDDDFGQLALFEALVGILELPHRCHHTSNGDLALQFLNLQPPYESAPRPQLILLDLNMPGKKGSEVLREIKSNPVLRSIPVIIVSSGEDADEISTCYQNHANAYITKAEDLDSALEIVKSLDRFWMQAVEFAG